MPVAFSFLRPRKHGVFLSFRGADTRYNFVSHLYDALRQEGIPTFIDSDEFERGKHISKILNEIEESDASIVILSKNYAASSWCLDELVKIMECMKTHGQHVIPVFYHVDPGDVANQTRCFGEPFAEHEKAYEANVVLSWRSALREASSLSGWVIGDDSPESAFTKEIVKCTLKKLSNLLSAGTEELVGVDPRMKDIDVLLCIGQADIQIAGIWGEDGVGKTTLARVLFQKYSSRFESSCFLVNVSEELERHGPGRLQTKLLEALNGRKTSLVRMMDRLRHRRVLIVLDGVDKLEEFIFLVGRRDWFGRGSRIILTSRNRQLLEETVDHNCIYKVPPLKSYEGFELFSFFALEKNVPESCKLNLSVKVLRYCHGNPLALKVLGASLFGRSEQEWENWQSALLKFQKTPGILLNEVMKRSYETLDSDEQQIFLDVACFYGGWPISLVKGMLEACGFSAVEGLRNLEERCLVIMSSSTVDMHNSLQEIGREIVRQECAKEPGNRSRLWDHNDICYVLSQNTWTENVRGISLNTSKISGYLCLAPTVFTKMNEMQFLKICSNGNDSSRNKLYLPQGLEYLPHKLRYLKWHRYPLKSLPANFDPVKLVELDMSFGNNERLWTGVKNLPNLTAIIMRHCKDLIEIPDLSRAQKLQTINLEGCESLLEVSPSIERLSSLVHLILRGCLKISSLPNCQCLVSLKILDLGYCSNLSKFPVVPRNMEHLWLDGTAMKAIPQSIGSLSSLRSLDLSFSSILSLPKSLARLSKLEILDLSYCKNLVRLAELPPSLSRLYAAGCTSLRTVPNSSFPLREGWDSVLEDEMCFDFTNCLQLEDNSRRNILNHGQQSILHLARATKLDIFVQKHDYFNKEEIPKCRRGMFCVPGNVIPEWISNQCAGSSITVQLPSNWCSNDFLGFVLCAVLGTNRSSKVHSANWITWEAKFKPSSYGESTCIYDEVEDKQYESDHVYLFYSSRFNGGANSKYNEVLFEVCPDVSKVKMLGVRLLYADDEKYRTDKSKGNACRENGKKKMIIPSKL